VETFNLRTIPGYDQRTTDPDLQTVILKMTGANGKEESKEFFLATPDVPQLKKLFVSQSLRYATHSTEFGVVGRPLIQLSLAICLRLYPVSMAIEFHREFAARHLMALPPTGNFTKNLIVPILWNHKKKVFGKLTTKSAGKFCRQLNKK